MSIVQPIHTSTGMINNILECICVTFDSRNIIK